MDLHTSVNMKSIRVVGAELDSGLRTAVEALESYLGEEHGDSARLDTAIDALKQLSGILKMVELDGAVELAAAIMAVEEAIRADTLRTDAAVLEALSRGLLYLPRYVDSVRLTGHATPLALVEPVNELRALLRQPLLWEFQLARFHWEGQLSAGDNDPTVDAAAALKRTHHLYQTGLLAVLRGDYGRAHWRVMERALVRLQRVSGQRASDAWWQLCQGVVQAFGCDALTLGIGRKRVLMAIDSTLRRLLRGPVTVSDTLANEMAWLVTIADGQHEFLDTARRALALPIAVLRDSDITAARNHLHGPGREALASMGQAIDEELKKVREFLEVISQGSAPTDAMAQVSTILTRVADTFKVAGIARGESLLRGGVELLAKAEQDLSLDQEDILLAIADRLLLVESITADAASMEQARTPDDTSETVGSTVAAALLRRSRLLAIRECEASVTLAKRAIGGYLESGFDPNHIDNLETILTAVRGALAVLGSNRAADVVQRSLRFVCDTVDNLSRQSRRQELMETLADALVSLECYLDDLALSDRGDDTLLQVAEESLAELGYASTALPGSAERRVHG